MSMKEFAPEPCPKVKLRVGRLMQVSGYLKMANMAMWTAPDRADTVLGMVVASVQEPGADQAEEELMAQLRALILEARKYYAAGDFTASMARVKVAADRCVLRILQLIGE